MFHKFAKRGVLNYCPGGLEKRQKCNCPPSPSNRHGIVRVRISVEVMIVAKITVRPKIIQKSPGVRGFSLGVFCFQRNPLKGGFSAGDFSEGFLRCPEGMGFLQKCQMIWSSAHEPLASQHNSGFSLGVYSLR